MNWSRFRMGVVCLALVSCDWPNEPTCDICTSSADVLGTVTAAGAPVVGASVDLDVAGNSCLEPAAPTVQGAALTSASGVYRIRVRVSMPPGVSCVVVRITPPSGSGLAPAADTVASLQFRADWKGPTSRDSARVDFALAPAP